MVQGQVFLKGALALFLFNFSKVDHFYIKSPFLFLFKPRKVGGLDQGWKELRESGRNCLKYLKKGWNGKEWRGDKDLKKRGQAESRGVCLKQEGGGVAGTPLRTMICRSLVLIGDKSGQRCEKYEHYGHSTRVISLQQNRCPIISGSNIFLITFFVIL